MSKEYFCDADRFAIALNDLLMDVVTDVDGSTMPVVKDACKKAANEVRKNARAQGWGSYAKEFSYKTSHRNLESLGEVGNGKRPGLVHLLEKGHAKVGGGRVEGRPHMGPAADVAEEYFWQEMQDVLEAVL